MRTSLFTIGFVSILFSFLSIQEYTAQIFDIGDDPSVILARTCGTSGEDKAIGIVCHQDGDFIVAGSVAGNLVTGAIDFVNSYHGGASDGFITRSDRNGNILWSAFVGGSGQDVCTNVAWASDGTIVVCGTTNSSDATTAGTSYQGGHSDVFVASFDDAGNQLWMNYIGGHGEESAGNLFAHPDGNFYIAGKTNSTFIPSLYNPLNFYSAGEYDGYIAVINAAGAPVSFRYFGGNGNDEVHDLLLNESGQIIVCGHTGGSYEFDAFSDMPFGGGATDAFIARLNDDMQPVDAMYIGGSKEDALTSMDMTQDGEYLLAGTTSSGPISGLPDSGGLLIDNQEAIVIRMDEDFGVLWTACITGNNIEEAVDIVLDPFGQFYVAGKTNSTDLSTTGVIQPNSGGNYDGFVCKYTPEGTSDWMTYYGNTGDDVPTKISIDRFGKLMLAGYTESIGMAVNATDQHSGGMDALFARFSDCDNPEIQIHTEDETTFCYGGSAMLTGCGALHYEWMNGDTLNVTNVDTTMSAFLIGHNVYGCYGRSNEIEIEALASPEIEIIPQNETVFCGYGQSTLIAFGSDEIIWNDALQTTGNMLITDTAKVYVAMGTSANGCTGSDFIEIVFNEIPEVLMATTRDTVCISDAPIELIGIPVGGIYYGNGIVNDTFDPTISGGGNHSIYYTFIAENGCSGESAPVQIEVFYYPTVILNAIDTMCTFDAIIELQGEPTGGFFNGDGVVGNTFDPSLPGTGPQNITYTYIDSNGCYNRDSTTIYVDPCIIQSIEGIDEKNKPFIYPNPANDYVTIGQTSMEPVIISIYNYAGQLVAEYNTCGKLTISTDGMPAGSYLVSVRSSSETKNIPLVVIP